MKKRALTCIICPRGCALEVTLGDGGEVLEVRGNACPRGKSYAITECTAPVRTVTTTALCTDGAVVPVKTSRPVPKGKIGEVMKEINSATVPNGATVGDVLIRGVAGTDADVVITGKRA